MLEVQRFVQGHFSRVGEEVEDSGWQLNAGGEAQCEGRRGWSAGLGQ